MIIERVKGEEINKTYSSYILLYKVKWTISTLRVYEGMNVLII